MLTPLTDGDPRIIGPYRVTNRIGAGGMGAVYLGFDDDGQAAAVKVPFVDRADDPQFRSRFRREVEAARLVRGRCVAQLLDADPDAEQPWLAAEYVEGASLGDAVKARGAVEPRILSGLAVGLADALVAIHAAGVVHRDLKPSNILMAWDGPKVIDFGIAKSEDSVDHTKTGMLVGTLVWMAPEQLRGTRAGPQADVFAWGACIAYAATGRPPFQAEGMHAVALQIINAEPDLAGVPDHLLRHVQATLAKDPADRPTATQLLAALVGRDVVNAVDADSAARTALDTWIASPPTSARTAMLGAAGGAGAGAAGGAGAAATRGSNGWDRTAAGPAGGYGGYNQPGQAGPGHGGPGSGERRSGLSMTAAVAAAVVLLLVAGGIALALMLSSGDDNNDGDLDQGVAPTSSVETNQPTEPQASPDAQPSVPASDAPDVSPTAAQTTNAAPSENPTPSPTATPTSSPTPEPTETEQPPPTEDPATSNPTPSDPAATPTTAVTP